MRLPALVVIATVGIGAGQAPVIQTQSANQPPRDAVKRAEPTGTARIKGRIVTADRGQAVRRAILSYPEDLRVVVVGTGGLSHQIHGERTGFNNTDWDMRFLELIERDPLQLATMRHAEYVELGGAEGVEVIMWLAMRGALSNDIRKVHQHYYLPMTTAMTVTLYEEPEARRTARHGDETAQHA